MKIWNQAPLVRLILPFIIGILSAVYLPFQIQNFGWIITPYLIFIMVIVLVPGYKISYRKSWLFGIAINILLFAFAYQLTIYKTAKFTSTHFSKFVNGRSFVYARLSQSAIEKERSLKMVMDVLAVKNDSGWVRTSGKAMIYLKKDERSLHLNYGDEIVFSTTFNSIPEPQNPGEFNYKRFLAFHNIFQQASANDINWKSIGINSGNSILRYSYSLRDKLLNILRSENVKDDEYAVGAALMLGYSDKLDAEIISAYSSTGALHVLSVSGLHVAIVYVVFNWLLFFFDKFKHGHIIKAVILILMLWFYSALTGLSPSVLRAAAMFSFIIIAKAFDRYTNIYNTLAASAFLLLALNPYLIMEVGFQLSYIAVIGIVYIQPKISQWFETDNWLLGQIWTITAVSVAAQIATFPLGLHYFHQFPNYFLLSNFIVIPISTIIIYLGIALFAFAKLSFLASYLALGFSWSVWLLNYSVKQIEKWPHALLQGISISVLETWLIYGMVLLFIYYFINRRSIYLISALGVVILILCSQIVEQNVQFRQNKFIVYNIPKTSAIDFISSKSNVLLTDSAFAKNESSLLFHVKHNWWDLGINNTKIISENYYENDLHIMNNKIQFIDKRIVIINKDLDGNGVGEHRKKVNIDYLIISNGPKLKMKNALEFYNPKQIIFDSSNPNYKLMKWKEECVELKQSYYSVSDSGAFEVDI